MAKTVAVGLLGIGVVDLIDGVDGADALDAEPDMTAEVPTADAGVHFVNPHEVQSYVRADGTIVEGYFRDGDGGTSVDRSIEDAGGYYRSNPDGDPTNNLNS